MRYLLSLVACITIACTPTQKTTTTPSPGTSTSASTDAISSKTKKMQAYPGHFNFYWDEKEGKVWLEIDKFDEEFLYVNSLQAGIGSNDIGLDRGQLGQERVVKFLRSGNKVLLTQLNYKYRANSDNADERQAVEEAFAQSVLWGFEVSSENKNGVLVDATRFLLQDAHGVTKRLQQNKQGTYRLEESRSAIYLPRTKNFPKIPNSKLPSLLLERQRAIGYAPLLQLLILSPSECTILLWNCLTAISSQECLTQEVVITK